MIFFDSHCHINDKSFDEDRGAMIERARQNSVSHIMIAGVSLASCKKALEIAQQNKNIFIAAGIHPNDTSKCSESVIQNLKKLASSEYVKAWGETGLDFNRMHSPVDIQEKWLERQMHEANILDLPLIFHERDTNGRFLEIISENEIKSGVIHCFSGSKKELEAYLDIGLYIGITGIVTILQRGETLRSLLKYIPEEKMLVETDAPYLTPTPQKNKTRRNEPSFLPVILQKIADVKGIDPLKLSDIIFQNTCNLFKIKDIP